VADRSRVRQVPLQGLVPFGESPLSIDACLDPTWLADPTRFYPVPPPIRPEVWETVDESPGVEVESLAFPSASPFGIATNDRVAVRFYRPARRRPAWTLLVLHGIWRQDTEFEDKLCRDLATHGVSSAAAFRQAIVDARGVLGLLRGRGVPVGIVGFSLGGIIAHVLMGVEPVDLGVSALAGGNTAGIVWESVLTRAYRRGMEARGMTFERLAALWATGDPLRFAARLRPPRLRMLNARYDRLVEPRFTQALWEALGRPAIRWLPAGHITAFLFRRTIVAEILDAMGLPRPVASARRGLARAFVVPRRQERWAA
jgi:hypothetical protein